MAKLTVSVRESIRNKVLKHRFDDEENAILKRLRAAGDKIYAALYSKAEHEYLNKAPDGFFEQRTYLYVQVKGRSASRKVEWNGVKPVAACHSHGYPKIDDKHAQLVADYDVVDHDKDEFKKRREAARKELDGILAGFSTYKSLRDRWPELGDFIPPDPTEGVRYAMVRVPETLNEKYKLPPKKTPTRQAATA